MTLNEFDSLNVGDVLYNDVQEVLVIEKTNDKTIIQCGDKISEYTKHDSYYFILDLPHYKEHIAIKNEDLEDLISTHKVKKNITYEI